MICVVLLPVPVIDPHIVVPNGMQITAIQKAVANRMGVTVEAMKGPGRNTEIARARMVSMYIARMCTNASMAKIGRLHGNRDHTTACYAVKRVSEWMRMDGTTGDLVQDLIETLGNLKGEQA